MKQLFVMALAILVAGCVTSSGGSTTPGASTGLFGTKKDDITIETAKAFSGKNQVVIGSFKVGFVTYNKASEKAGGGIFSSGGAGHATARTTLEGVDDATMQKITDAAYADFVAQLQASGYTVADRSTITGTAEYQKAAVETSPDRDSDFRYLSGSDVTYFAPTGLPLHGAGFAFSAPGMAFATLGEKTGIPVLDVQYVVNFANADGYGGSYRSTAAVNVGQGLSVVPGSGVTIYGGQGGTFSTNIGTIGLGQPVYSTEEFAQVQELTTGGEKALGYAANVFSLALGGGSSISREYAVNADPVKYETLSADLLKQSSQKLASAMAANR